MAGATGPLGENNEGRPQCDSHKRQPEFLPYPYVYFMASVCAGALPIDHPERIFLQRADHSPVPFATTTTMLEAFVQQGEWLTLDRSDSRLSIDCRATKLIMGNRIAKIAAAALERCISFVFSNSASELASKRGMRQLKRFLGLKLGRSSH